MTTYAPHRYLVVDRRGLPLRGFDDVIDAMHSQHEDDPIGYGVVRASDGAWLSRRLGSAPDIESAARLTWREAMEMPVEIEEEAMEDG